MACGKIYTKLEQGSKASSKSQAWFGQKKHIRRTDELLVYLQYARNADYHGLGKVVNVSHGLTNVRGYPTLNMGKVPSSQATGNPDDWIKTTKDGYKTKFIHKNTGFSIEIFNFDFGLLPVYSDVTKRTYEPPKVHLGKSIEPTPWVVSRLAIAYLESLLDEARLLPQVD